MRDGIAVYVRDQVGRLRRGGADVSVLSPPEGGGELREPFRGGRAFVCAARSGRIFDRIVVHFQPSLFFAPRRPVSKVATSARFLMLAVTKRGKLEIVVHEADPPKLWRPDYLLLAMVFRAAGQLTFHTEAERRHLERAYPGRIRGRVVAHLVAPAISEPSSRRAARDELGLPEVSTPVFVCAGFLQASKGYDRAVEAFARLRTRASPGSSEEPSVAAPASLYVVGSVRESTPDNLAYARDLGARCEATPGVALVNRFVDDREFDLWIAAADRLVLPYRRSWSSGVLARAHALGTPALVADVGGLAEQADEHDVMFRDDQGLREAMQDVVDPHQGGGAGG
jgi:glycosyltransferase involved in cell wall biosynthesis